MDFEKVKEVLKGLAVREVADLPCWCPGIVGYRLDGGAMHTSACAALRGTYARLRPESSPNDAVLRNEVSGSVKMVALRYEGGLPCFCPHLKPGGNHNAKCAAVREMLASWAPPAPAPVAPAPELPTGAVSLDELPPEQP